MSKPIGIRLPEKMLKEIEKISKEEMLDRSTVIRKLVIIGYKNMKLENVVKEYLEGKITFSEAAGQAGLTLWELESYLVSKGFKSSYSVKDLEKEMKILK